MKIKEKIYNTETIIKLIMTNLKKVKKQFEINEYDDLIKIDIVHVSEHHRTFLLTFENFYPGNANLYKYIRVRCIDKKMVFEHFEK